jgi:hypothetical protein
VRIDLGGPALEFVKLDDPDFSARYAAELDGVRVPIRVHRAYRDCGYGGTNSHTDDEEGMTALLWDLDDIAGVTPRREGDAFVFEFDERRHYNSFKLGRIAIKYEAGVVHWDAKIDEQNDSYY